MQPRQRQLLLKLLLNRCNRELAIASLRSAPARVQACPHRAPERRSGGVSQRLAALLISVASFTLGAATPMAPVTIPPSDVAELIVNIARYTSWPKSATPKALTICHAHGAALPVVLPPPTMDWSVRGAAVTWLPITSPKQVAECNIVWLSSDVHPAPRAWIVNALDQPILTISNYADFTADGGVIGAYRVGQDWRFEINLEALQRSRVNIAAVALRLSQKPRMSVSSGEAK